MRKSKIVLSLALVAALIAGGVALVPTLAAERGAASGDGPAAWLSIGQVVGKLEAAGYRNVEKIEREHGGYEARATDRSGARVKLDINPRTGEVIEQRQDGRRHDRGDDEARGGKGGSSSADCNKRRCRDDLPVRPAGTPAATR
jgi:hypothetical protein